MRVAVTGSSGQLGTQVLRRLIDDRQIKSVVALDLVAPRLPGRKVQFVRCDVREPEIATHFAGCDAVVHLAFLIAQAAPRGVFESVNVGGSKNVFAAAAKAGVKSIVYSSSVAAYGVVQGHPTPIVEDTPRIFQPGFAYSATKFQVEEHLDAFEKEHPDIAVCRLRPSILIGRGMDHPLGRALKRGVIPDFGAPTLPLVWNEDVADAVLLALKQRARGAFILSAGEQLSAADLARAVGMRRFAISRRAALAVARVSPLLSKLGLIDAVDRAWIEANDAALTFSSDKARRELGWKPRCNTSVEVMRRYLEVVSPRLDRRIALFFRIADLSSRLQPAQVELEGFRSRLHLSLTGPGGGDGDISITDGRVRIRRGTPASPTAIVTLPAALFLDLLAGRSDVGTAQLTGRVRVEGEGHAALLFAGIVTRFRSLAEADGARGRFGKLLQRMIGGARAPEPGRAA